VRAPQTSRWIFATKKEYCWRMSCIPSDEHHAHRSSREAQELVEKAARLKERILR
jgi:hypothetical protein